MNFTMQHTHIRRVCMCGTEFILHGKIGLNKNQADKEICRKVSWGLELEVKTK